MKDAEIGEQVSVVVGFLAVAFSKTVSTNGALNVITCNINIG